ncbi:inositol 1,4,5-triphosphate receptor associated 2-like isoform X1 [Bombus pyrosoma]|uniref:inositol 1,4,5-triphosphate receptor associated 2-like isoform X1 n=1 Tax=Bombus pyrosoma TaxID=396416 RepID=UPI001CB9607D|nr:inositol 1,4,5-triphosphate receptor associated 2-like isoform X1 [Bombus pyrosoma]XP_043578950.1 inositol 1,4,5-triphosphate receptor associated 2-like isoform X1 [Bombus pyrosoma]XP_043578959.1 inositol 1,4,5-triphosphate receptor associated 2-like isoform X1 [Bombus pyrosoma]XP_043578969.1 inositol 1,4,5-triphosphate receptor associated 2-like isoform X1 [Bombus pyrosoma]XP_043578977.1 inositol 1,4,5-triphosphate receptor associated 2-like isoform X1 [Bombus pyrosoma]XP_043578984.1 inosi
MDESTSDNEKQPRSQEVDADQKQRTSIKATNYMTSNDTDLSKIPKRKLSVFYRSFDVIAQVDQEKEKQTLDFRRTSSSPSVQIERTREDVDSKNGQIDQERHFVDDYRSLNENGKFLSCSSPSRLGEKPSSNNGQVSKAGSLSPIGFKLPQVLEDTIVDNYATITETSIGKHYKLNNNGNYEYKVADESAVINSRQTNSSPDLTNTIRSFAKEKVGNAETNSSANGTAEPQHGNSPQTRSACSRAITCTDLVKIKDSEYPRSFVNASGARRLGKYTSVDAEMSSHEDSSMGSDSEDDSIERTVHATICTRNETKNERSRSKSNSPLSQTLSFISMGEPSRKLNLREIHDQKVAEDVEELCPERVERQKLFAARRSLSEGDCERYHRTKRRCRCVKEEESLDEEQEKFPAFPSFNDTRLQIMGLSCSNDIDSVYRENIPENELERKYIAFSIGLSTDRITLHRRMALSLRQRDQSERNFMNEIQKMQEDINGLCPLCTDQESIDKIENVRHQLDMITRSAHRVSCAAETLGAVYQEHRISRAIFIGDKYLQLLRSRCENLAADIADVKQILLKNNIMIEETTGEMGDDLPKLRYRNGLPCNNRTMMTRRRASIATISRPLSTQDIKEIPRQRNSVSGRVNLRRPSLCFETQRWENEKLNRTDSTNSVVELREIFEHTEPRRNSIEENNNLLRNDQSNNISSMNCNIASNTRDKDRSIIKQNSFLESSVTKTVEKQIKSCIQTTEPLRITRNIETWRSILWFIFIFFLGFYAKQITSTFVT